MVGARSRHLHPQTVPAAQEVPHPPGGRKAPGDPPGQSTDRPRPQGVPEGFATVRPGGWRAATNAKGKGRCPVSIWKIEVFKIKISITKNVCSEMPFFLISQEFLIFTSLNCR